MLNTKNPSSGQLAFLSSVFLALLASILVFIFTRDFIFVGLTFCALTITGFFFIRNLLNQLFFRKIKLIYKFISKEKKSLSVEKFEEIKNNAGLMDQVQLDVEKWALEKRSEIQQLQGNDSFRKEFLMNLAHELRTPIFSIQGYIATLLDGEMNNPEVNYKFLERAAKSADRLDELVEDVNTISKYESNRIEIKRELFVIQDVIQDVFEELLPKANLATISFAIKKGSEAGVEVYADYAKVKQVLINLIENGIKYGKENGNVTAGIYVVDKNVLVEITDNGMGIDEEAVLRVFERFYRTDAARTKDGKGNGLGLAIAKHIIEAHGHDISCRSTLGQGTTFGFTLEKSLN